MRLKDRVKPARRVRAVAHGISGYLDLALYDCTDKERGSTRTGQRSTSLAANCSGAAFRNDRNSKPGSGRARSAAPFAFALPSFLSFRPGPSELLIHTFINALVVQAV